MVFCTSVDILSSLNVTCWDSHFHLYVHNLFLEEFLSKESWNYEISFPEMLWLNSCAHSFPLNVLKYFSQDLLFSNRAQEYVLEITLLRVLKIRKISMAARRLSRLFDRVGNRKCDRDSEYNLIWIVIVWKAAGGIRIFASIISIQNND